MAKTAKLDGLKISCYTARHQQDKICNLPPSRVLNAYSCAAGPEPAFVLALTLKVYEVKGVRLDIRNSMVDPEVLSAITSYLES